MSIPDIASELTMEREDVDGRLDALADELVEVSELNG
jgi:hypothetical protein